MRKLTRPTVPHCLGGYTHGTHSWGDVNAPDKEQIRAQLETMQGKRCAYCEGSLDTLGQHIEHFRRKSANPTLTFDWANLFWSCDQSDSCGHFKDRGAGVYNVADLIEPCSDDPDDFIVFRADGRINVRSGLSASDEKRAKETLRVFSLHPHWGRLRNMRQAAVAGYVEDASEAVNAGLTREEIRAYFASELKCAEELPFYTAIRHVLTESP